MDMLEVVKQHIEAGDKASAARELSEILRAEPRNVSAWLLLASLLDDPQKQLDCYRRILHIDPQHPQAQRHLRALHETLRSSVAAESEALSETIVPSYAEPLAEYGEFDAQVEAARFDYEKDAQALSPDEEKALVEYVVKALSSHVRPRNVLFEVCHRSGMSWQDAEAFVARVSAEHRHRIAASKSPLSLFLGIGTILAGIVVTFGGGVVLIDSWQYLSTLDDWSFLNSVVRHSSYYLRGFGIIFLGLSMMLGGTAGVVMTVRSLKRGDKTDT
jgi:hypothetical protein